MQKIREKLCFHHLLLLDIVPDPLIMCTTERITSILHWCMCTKTVYHVFWWWKFYCPRIFPGVALLPKTQKTLGTRLSMTSMCTIGQWGVCYAYLRSKLLHLPIYTPWPLIPSHINYVILFYSFEIPLQNLCPTSKEVHVHGKNPQVTFDLET